METKKRLLNAISELLKSKSIEKITIGEISEKAFVSRATFYHYFDSKYALANEFYITNINEELLCSYDGSNYEDVAKKVYVFVKENYHFFKNSLKSEEPGSMYDFWKQYSIKIYSQMYIKKNNTREIPQDIKFKIDLLANKDAYCLKKWILSGCKEDIKNVIEWSRSISIDDIIDK